MSKYLKTIINKNGLNKKVILKVDRCNDCPLMKFSENDLISSCRVFGSAGITGNILDNFVINYDTRKNKIIDKIDIPHWCELKDSAKEINNKSKTYVVYNDKVLSSYVNDDEDEELPIQDAFYYDDYDDEDECGVSDDMLPAIIASSFLKSNLSPDEAYDIAYSEYENSYNKYDSDIIIDKKETCSSCGEKDDSVVRNNHLGMCDSCWEKLSKNDKKKKQAYINNFRIKRGQSYNKKNFNSSILNNILID